MKAIIKHQNIENVELPEELPQDFEVLLQHNNEFVVKYNNKVHRILLLKKGEQNYSVLINGKLAEVSVETDLDILLKKLGVTKKSHKAAKQLKAPMPGLVKKILVKPGDKVQKHTPVLILEAMKMENVIQAEGEATVKEIVVKEGTSVEKNEILIKFDV